MKHWFTFGSIVSAGALAGACTTTTVNPGTSAGSGGGSTASAQVSASSTTSVTATSTQATSATAAQTSASTSQSSSVTTGGGGTCAMPKSIDDCKSCPDGASCQGDANNAGCCTTAVALGVQAYNQLLFQTCGCTQGADCTSDCADPGDYCDNPETASNGCLMCITNVINAQPPLACYKSFLTACQADADCNLFYQCQFSCPPE